MELNPTAAAATTAAAAAAARTKTETEAGAATSDFQTFLQLLTAQLRNQDPLKPMESTEFVAQLASFSAVEQQVRTNDRLDRIAEMLSGGTPDGLAQWIGREVRAPVAANYQGVPVEVEVTPKEGADTAVLVVRNDFGQIVARKLVLPGSTLVTWDGSTDQGTMAANGSYKFELESFMGETQLDAQPGRVFGQVTEVRLEEGSPVLILAGGIRVPLEEVSAVR
jgi:flagellar basal-body rod modification protein FlgD